MNPHTAWRLAKGKEIAAIYAKNPKLAALVVAGSVGRDWTDEWSDIELDLYWHEPPTDEDRKQVIEAVNGKIVYYYPLEGHEWSDAYMVDGLKFEVSSFLASTPDQYIDEVVIRNDDDVDKQLRLAAIQNSIPLHGIEQVQRWRARCAIYPDSLAEKIIRANVDFGGWNSVEYTFARGDLLLAYDLLAKVQKQVLVVLLALNRTYVAHPRGKWLARVADGMMFKPANLTERMLFALKDGSVRGAQVMTSVLEDVFVLVEEQFPHLDLSEIKKDVRFQRRPLEIPT